MTGSSSRLLIYEYDLARFRRLLKDVPTGINEEIVRFISDVKDEPQWMRERHLMALDLFERKPMPAWVGSLP